MSNTLYQIKQEFLDTLNHLEATEGELTDDIQEALEIHETELREKSLSYRAVITQKEEFILTIDAEIKRLQTMKKREQNKISWLKQSLVNAITLFGDIKTDFCTFTQSQSKRLSVVDIEKIPAKYKTIEQSVKVDKNAIKQGLKQGEDIKGVELEVFTNLKVK